MRAGTHRDRTPEETPHGGRKPPKNQEGAGAGTKERRKRAPRQAPRPTPRKGTPRRGGRAPPHPHQTPHDTRGRTSQHTPPKQVSDAVRITPAHTHQPPETTRRMEGTATRGERATPTEEATGNADTGPRHRPPGRATPRTVTRSTYPTHQPERHARAPTARTQRDTHT